MDVNWIWCGKVKFFMDTNFLIVPEKFQIDIFEEIRKISPDAKFATVRPVVIELQKLKKRFALELIKKFGVEIIEATGKADDALLNTTQKEGGALCTNDIELKKKCIKKKIPVVFLRNKKTLEIQGG